MTTLSDEPDPPIRVLYVDDDEAFADLVRTKLDLIAPSVELIFENGLEPALDRLDEGVDCVVTAYSLADGSGIDLVERVEECDDAVPTILFTGRGSERIAGQATQAGVSDYIPIQSEQDEFEILAARIETLVDAARQRRRADAVTDRFRRTIERTTDAIYAVDSEWRIEYMNERMATRVDCDPDAVVGGVLWKEFPTILGTELEANYRAAMESGEPVSFEQYLGDPFDYWVEVRAFPDDDGLTVFSREITGQRERRLELQRQERILQNVHDVVFAVDADLDVRFANSAAARLLGQDSPADLEDRSLAALVDGMATPEAVEEFRTAVSRTLSGNATESDGGLTGLYDFDLRIGLETRAGDRTFDVRLTPFEAADVRQVLVVARDVTDQSEARTQLERERDALGEIKRVMADSDLTTDTRLQRVLASAREVLDLDVGILAGIDGDDYEITAVSAPDIPLSTGDEFDLGETFCDLVVDRGEPVSFTSSERGGVETHPAYEKQGMESYLGAPIAVDGSFYGTLNFSSPDARDRPFSAFETTLVRLLAQWIGTELSRRRSKELAEASRDRLRQIIDILPQLVFVKDASGEYLLANEPLAEAYGTSVDELEGATDAAFAASPDEVEQFQTDDLEVIESGEPKHIPEEPLTAADGERRIVETTKIPYEPIDADGDAVLGVATDITERKRRERELARYEALVESMDTGAVVVDSDGRLEYVNERIVEQSADSRAELEGRPVMPFAREVTSDASALDRFEAALDAALAGEDVPHDRVELEVEAATGDRTVEYLFSSFRHDDERKAAIVTRDITDRTERERELREIKERLDLAVTGANLGVWDWNVETGDVTFNDQWAEMLGYAPEEVEDHLDAWERRVHPDDLPEVEATLQRHLDGETDYYDAEHRMRTSDGDWMWIRDVGKVVERGDDGTPKRAVGIHIDIDERKASETSLEEERDMFAEGPAVVFKWRNEDGWPVEYVSDNVTETFGYSPEQLQSGTVPYSDLVHDDDLRRVVEEVEANSDDTTERFSHEPYRMVTADGEVKWVTDNTKIVREDGEITHYLGYLIDITERKRLERKLRALQRVAGDLATARSVEEIGAMAVDAATDILGLDLTGIWAYDERADALEPVAETEDARAVSGDSPRFTPGDSLAWRAFEAGELRTYDDASEIDGRYNDDTPIQSEILLPLGDHGLMSTGATAPREFTDKDVDLFRVLGAAVEAAMVRAEREHELRRQNERLDRFASVVAHDLRNPLSVAKGFREVVEETGDLSHLERVASAHDRIEHLIDDLLTLAKGESTVEDPERVALDAVATEAWGYVDTDQASLTVTDAVPTIHGDPGRVTQLFENLFRNSVEHGATSGDTETDLTITVGDLSGRDGFYVEDDGVGIPPDRRDEVLEHGVSYGEGGTGFGLSIVSDIASAHRWDVSLTEGPDGGARFEFETTP
ncbi:PAS domain S-box protein [Halorientalis regularis]|uniref:histidine kinase n=1 Tax=Halorientalis regularis TaxID=660518 RepID=A0A1G7PL53_9EURY|nr:PAS domain S-box protein [Halorientalis regularis]SDF86981.1 PAS domain S-box-containing protein [Halorientalis regularis]